MEWWFYLPAVVWSLWALCMGLLIGSFINVLVARLPFEKSVVWPSSRCFSCYRKVRLTDNIPILGYLRLRGKCRYCGTPFSARHLWVEAGTGLAFLALFVAEVLYNWHRLPGVKFDGLGPEGGVPSMRALAIFAYHATLVAGLIAAAAVDIEHRIIPTQITYTVMAVGVIGGALMPWPWPHAAVVANAIPRDIVTWAHPEYAGKIAAGVQPWPCWGPTPDFAPPGSWKLGLLTSVVGALAGSLVVRGTKWAFETGLGREALGLGDADLLMMAGAFLGWQIVVLSMFVGSFASLILKVLGMLLQRTSPPAATAGTSVSGAPEANELPFGPGLAIGVAATWFAWPWIGARLQFPFFDATMMAILVGVMGVGLLSAALFLRRPAEVAPAPAK